MLHVARVWLDRLASTVTRHGSTHAKLFLFATLVYLLLNQMDESEKEPKPETKEPAAAVVASTDAKADTSGTNPSKKPGGELAR